MTLDPAEKLPAEQHAEAAANEDSTGILTPPPRVPERETGWDPYEVWRTRVRTPSKLAWAPYERDRRR